MVDEDRVHLKYSTCQRNFESRLTRYKSVLSKEKKEHGINEMESELSSVSWRTNDFVKYMDYLQRADRMTRRFYRLEKWRGWKFQMYRMRRSEDRLLNRIAKTYGEECTMYYGNWSRRGQMTGCDPSPVKGIRASGPFWPRSLES